MEPDPQIVVLYSDIQNSLVDGIRTLFPSICLQEVDAVRSGPADRASIADLRIRSFANFIDETREGTRVFMFDSDLMFRREISESTGNRWDLFFTVQPRALGFPVNSGLFGIKAGPHGRAFARCLDAETSRIMQSRMKTRRANRSDGGPSQSAIRRLVPPAGGGGGKDSVFSKNVMVKGIDYRVLLLPREEYNENDARRIGPGTRVIHLKSRWQDLIYDRKALPGLKQEGYVDEITSEFNAHLLQVRRRAGANLKTSVDFFGILS